MKYIFATNNSGKVKEIRAMFAKAGLELLCLADLDLEFYPNETGLTFESNSYQKAFETLEFLRKNGHDENVMTVLADDSGLVIEALEGVLGVDSANFMGRDTPYSVRNKKIIEMLENSQTRVAYFECVITCVGYKIKPISFVGKLYGEITKEPSGENGFGYDPIFFVPQFNKTLAELTQDEKNSISHRGEALRQLLDYLKGLKVE